MSRFVFSHLSPVTSIVQLPLRANSQLVLGRVFPALREVVCVPDRRLYAFMFVPARAAFAWCVPKRGCSLLRHSGSPGEWDSCFVPWCAVGKALRGLLWPWARIQSLRRALSSSPRVCASSSPLLPWLCSTCWQQALRGMVWQGHATYRAWFGLMG